MDTKILFFDPYDDREETLSILSDLNIQVTSVYSTFEVYEKLKTEKFTVLISDINLKNESLQSYLTTIKEIIGNSEFPHIAVTSTRDIFDISLAETFLVRPILLKPIFKESLINAVKFLSFGKPNGLILCSNNNIPFFTNAFLSMGFITNIISKKQDFNQFIYNKKVSFIVYETGFSEMEVPQLLNRLLSISEIKIPIYLFLKKEDILLKKLLSEYEVYRMQLPPWDFSVVEEQIQNLILSSKHTYETKQISIIKGKEEDQNIKKLIETSETEEHKPNKINRIDETDTGKISLSAFFAKIENEVKDDEIATPLILYFKKGQIAFKKKCIDALESKKGEKYIQPILIAYNEGNDALREIVIELITDFKPNQNIFLCLCNALQDKLPSIQYTAILGLHKYKIEQIAPYLQKLISSQTDSKIKQAAAKLLEDLKDVRMFNSFLIGVVNSLNIAVMHSFIKYVQLNFKSITDMNAFVPIFKSENTQLKEFLLEYFIETKNTKTLPFFYMVIASKNRVLTRLSIEGLKTFNDINGVPHLLTVLDTKEGSIAETAIINIINNNASPKYADIFLLVMQKTDDRLREEVINIVKNFKENENNIILKTALKLGGTGTKIAAIEAMDNWDTKSIILSIGPLLDDNDRAVSDYVYTYIKENSHKNLIETFIRLFLSLKQETSKEIIVYLLADLVQNENSNTLLSFCKKDNYSLLVNILRKYSASLGKFTSEVFGNKLKNKESIDIVLKTLYDQDVEARAEAAFIIGENKFKEGIPHLVKFIDDQNWHVRRVVIESLGKLNAKEVMPVILKKLKDENTGVRVAAAKSLQELGVRFKESLIPMFMQEDSVKVLEEMTKLLVPFKNDEASEFYLPKLSSSNIITRINAFTFLLSLWDNLDKMTVYSWIESKNWKLRLLALTYFSKDNPERIIDTMNVYIMDTSEEIRKFIIEFIFEHHKENALEHIQQFINDENPLIRIKIINLTSKILNENTLNFLISLFDNEENEDVLMEILYAFENFQDNRILTLLNDRVNDFTNINLKKKTYDILSKY